MIDDFDWIFYINFYSQLKETTNNPLNAYNHYINIGKKKGFFPNQSKLVDNFDWKFYLELYPDLKSKLPFQVYNHYLNHGKKENRKPNVNALNIHIKEQQTRILNEYTNFVSINKTEVLMNVLIRTSNRPQYFDTCIQSILDQTYSNYRIIICYDNPNSLYYLNKYTNNTKIEFHPIQIDSTEKYKFNLYCNFLMEKVDEGWIMFLDDDDKLAHKNVFNIINNSIMNDNILLIWNFFRPDKLIFPDNICNINLGMVDTCSFCFHSKYKGISQWYDKKCGDFFFFSKLTSVNMFTITYLDYILTQTIFTNKIGNFGN